MKTTEPPVSFGGLEISSGPLYFNGTSYEIKDSWNYTSYNTTYGKTAGSTYFNYIEMGQLFTKSDFDINDGNILNSLDPFGGWRLPTYSELENLLNDYDGRSGSTVNERESSHFAVISITGVSYAGKENPYGLLLFPDGKNISGATLDCVNSPGLNSTLTLSELNNYLSQGCAFFPASGLFVNNWDNGGSVGRYGTSTCYDEYVANYFQFVGKGAQFTNELTHMEDIYVSIRLVRPINP